MRDDREDRGGRKGRGRASCCLGMVAVIGAAVLGGAIWLASGPPGDLSISPQPPMPSPNGLDDFLAAGGMLKATGGSSAALARLRLGLTRPCRLPPASPTAPLFPQFARMRELARLLGSDADVRASRGDYTGAFGSAADGMRMGAAVTHGGGMVASFVGIAVQGIARVRALRALDHLDASQCLTMAGRVRTAIGDVQPMRDTLLHERDMSRMWMRDLDREPSRLLATSGTQPAGASGGSLVQGVRGAIAWRVQRAACIRDTNAYFDAWMRQADLPLGQQKPIPRPQSKLAETLTGTIEGWVRVVQLERVRERLLLCALRLRAHILTNGAAPASLAELGLPARYTTDPMSGQPFVYKPLGKEYLLYSVGLDPKDDGGVPVDEANGPNGPGDLGVRPYSSKLAGTASDSGKPVPHMRPPGGH